MCHRQHDRSNEPVQHNMALFLGKINLQTEALMSVNFLLQRWIFFTHIYKNYVW